MASSWEASSWEGDRDDAGSGDAGSGDDAQPPTAGAFELSPGDRRMLLAALAAAFPSDAAADLLLSEIGFPRSRRLSIDHSTALTAWADTLHALDNGAIVAPYARLLRAATAFYPGSKVFRSLTARYLPEAVVPGEGEPDSRGSMSPGSNTSFDPSASARPDFFISYAPVDEAWAEWVASVLERHGLMVGMQAWDAPPGRSLVRWMSGQMAAARVTLALCSPSYFESHWCDEEWQAALPGQPLVVLRVGECAIPAVLSTTGYQDLFGVVEGVAEQRLREACGLGTPPRIGFPGSPLPAAVRGSPALRFPGPRSRVWGVPGRHRWFVGRDDQLERLRRELRAEPSGRLAVQVICGIAGGGKTQLAVEFAHRFAADYDIVWWIPAEHESAVVDSLDGLADALALAPDPDRPRRARAVLRRLHSLPRWLLVYDSVPEPAAVTGWLPDGNGHVLVNGLSRANGELGPLTELAAFTREESCQFLSLRAGYLRPAEIDRIAAELGDLPLAIAQAASFLTITHLRADVYVRLLGRAFTQAFPRPPADYPRGLAGAIAASHDKLRQRDPAASRLLRDAAFLGNQPVPFAVLALLAGGDDPLVAVPVLLYAIDLYALAQVDGDRLQLHRLTQAFLRGQVRDRDRVVERLAELLGRLDPGDPEDPASWPAYADCTDHVMALLAQLRSGDGGPGYRRLVLAVARYLEHSGQFTTALELTDRVGRAWRAFAEDEILLDGLRAARVQARILRMTGRAGEARDLDADSVRRCGALLGPDHPDTLASTTGLGLDLRELGDRHGALDLHEQALVTARRALGPDHLLTLDIAGAVALDLHGLGRAAQARALDEDTLDRLRKRLGPTDPRTVSAMMNLARDLRVLGSRQQDADPADVATLRLARDLDRQAYEACRSLLGEDHPRTLAVADAVAVDHYALGETALAQALHERVVPRLRRVLGDDNPLTLRVTHNLANDLRRAGDLRAAQTLHRDVLDRLRQVLGPDHGDTLHCAHNLARDLADLGRAPEAVALYRDTLARRTRVLGADHAETRRTARRLSALQDHPGHQAPST